MLACEIWLESVLSYQTYAVSVFMFIAPLFSAGNLAGCLIAMGNAAEALKLFYRVLDAHERQLGQNHVNTLSAVANVASVSLTSVVAGK